MTDYHPPATDQVSALAALVADSFNTPQAQSELWVERSGIENWRVLLEGDTTIVGGLMQIPMAQWFGGRPVSMTGLAGVAVSAFGRGRRFGQRLLEHALSEMRESGTALSALYASTSSFYRRCGYERAGSRFLAEVQVRELTSRGGPLEVRPLTAENEAEAEALQARLVRNHGALVRGPYLWLRVRGPRGMTAQGYGFYRAGRLEGYAYLVKHSASFRDNFLEATDVVLSTPDALTTYFGLLAGHRAFFTSARWPGTPTCPLLFSLPESWQYKLALEEHWMLRVVSLQQALLQRGYPAHLKGELHLQVDDPWFADNSGPWVLEVAGGEGAASRGGRGDLKLDIGSLASLYTGFLSAEKLALAGRASGSPDALALASAIFGGWTPELADFF